MRTDASFAPAGISFDKTILRVMQVRVVREEALDASYDAEIYVSRIAHPSDKDRIEDGATIYRSVFGS